MKRRAFFSWGIAIATTIVLPVLTRPVQAAKLEAQLANLLDDQAAARTIGEAYLAQTTPGIEASSLLSALSEKLGPALHRGGQTRGEIRGLVTKRIRLDFAQGDCVHVDGWVLSKTEVELCALAALRL